MPSKPSCRTIQIVDIAIDINDWMDPLRDPDVGAMVWFTGVTRRTTQHPSGITITQTLSYEANQPMAIKSLQHIADQAIEQFDLQHVVIVHRIGDVPIGDASVLVGCSSPHRKSSFAALPWIMDRLKADVPIWKKEHEADGRSRWIHPGIDA